MESLEEGGVVGGVEVVLGGGGGGGGGRGEVCREDILYVSPPRGKASEANADLVARYLVKLGMWLVE